MPLHYLQFSERVSHLACTPRAVLLYCIFCQAPNNRADAIMERHKINRPNMTPPRNHLLHTLYLMLPGAHLTQTKIEPSAFHAQRLCASFFVCLGKGKGIIYLFGTNASAMRDSPRRCRHWELSCTRLHSAKGVERIAQKAAKPREQFSCSGTQKQSPMANKGMSLSQRTISMLDVT